jgi:hypothetical protein
MLDPMPNQVRSKCACCSHWFVAVEGFAEFCSEECAFTAMRYSSEGEWRRCFQCRAEFLALETSWRICQVCQQRKRSA